MLEKVQWTHFRTQKYHIYDVSVARTRDDAISSVFLKASLVAKPEYKKNIYLPIDIFTKIFWNFANWDNPSDWVVGTEILINETISFPQD